jgi:hypothetical protein
VVEFWQTLMTHAKPATIEPFRRSGSWEFDGGLREQTVRALELAEQVSADRRNHWEVARERQLAGDNAAGRLVSRERIVERNLFTTAAVVLSAMAVEAFLNFYGVKRMGQTFYELHYERLGLVRKVTGIVAMCCGLLLDDDAEIVSVARALSKARNRLAHPKTREVRPEAGSSHFSPMKHPLETARESVANMNLFFQLFAAFDPDSSDIVHAI